MRGFDVQARCRRLRVEAPTRCRGVTPVPRGTDRITRREEAIMATQALTVRGIDALKPKATRFEVFDALTARSRDSHRPERTQVVHARV